MLKTKNLTYIEEVKLINLDLKILKQDANKEHNFYLFQGKRKTMRIFLSRLKTIKTTEHKLTDRIRGD